MKLCRGERADPKQLLMSSAAACYLMTLVFLLDQRDQSRIPVAELSMETEGNTTSEGQLHHSSSKIELIRL
ncbi:OsmC family protein [Paenibacillus sp. ES5-4]